jgi:hypothetical protein
VPGDLPPDRGRYRERIGVVDVQNIQIRARVSDATQQPLDLVNVAMQIREEARLLTKPEMAHTRRMQAPNLEAPIAG